VAARHCRPAIGDADHRPVAALVGQEVEPLGTVDLDGSLPTTVKNVFRSNARARNVFGPARPATNCN
jgi:hypothetical protein